ncbi:DUF58 domain-containing protein [Undibacterium sp. TJN19]|uniref:DUF58 domain-containing protein n=1 Tax=Undibacterium sp. TJN19 TaxID=3413055 RepID=UPI003BF231B9
MLKAIKTRLRKLIFLEHKPESGEVFLKQRRVFTLPSKAGWAFVVLLMILFIGATNYNLNLGFALTYVLGGIGMVNNFFSFRNLAYLHLAAGSARSVFAGEETEYTVYLINRTARQRFAIWVGFAEQGHPEKAVDIAANSQVAVQLSYPTTVRGWQAIPRIRLQTWFPLGLLRAWSTWLPDAQTLVYPQPELNPPPLPLSGKAKNEIQGHAGEEDFAGVRAYQSGDPLKHLAWKQIARVETGLGGQLITKQFSGGSGSDVMLDFAALPRNMDTELKLSRMTSWVLEADQHGMMYGFRLGHIDFLPAQGPEHCDACLRALALYEM